MVGWRWDTHAGVFQKPLRGFRWVGWYLVLRNPSEGTQFGIFALGECPRWKVVLPVHAAGMQALIRGFVSMGIGQQGLSSPPQHRFCACASSRSRTDIDHSARLGALLRFTTSPD